MSHHPDSDYECLKDPACRDWWDGYYSPSHSVRCAKHNKKILALSTEEN